MITSSCHRGLLWLPASLLFAVSASSALAGSITLNSGGSPVKLQPASGFVQNSTLSSQGLSLGRGVAPQNAGATVMQGGSNAGPVRFNPGAANLGGQRLLAPAGPAQPSINPPFRPPLLMPGGPILSPASDGQLAITYWPDDVVVSVPEGYLQVMLEQQVANSWKPVATAHLNGEAQNISFKRPQGATVGQLRAIGSTVSKFAPAVYKGARSFEWTDPSYTNITLHGNAVSAGTLQLTGQTVALTQTTPTTSAVFNTAAATTTPATTTAQVETPAAVESDIWKVVGNRLFFFNQFRGLQVFDMTSPEHPVKTGSLRMAMAGEQFYALDGAGSHLALLTRDTAKNVSYYSSLVQLLSISDKGVPTLVKQITLQGAVVSSRLIGSRLYVLLSNWGLSSIYQNSNLVLQGYSGIVLQGFDLADPSQPESLGVVNLPSGWGYGYQFQASGSYLLASCLGTSGSQGSNNKLSVIDISDAGKLRLVKTVTTKGSIADQFKMEVVGGWLMAVSEVQQSSHWISGTQLQIDPRQTWVETFALNDAGVAAAAQLHLASADGEQLFATRFDGRRLYVVTFGVKQTGPTILDVVLLPRDPLYVVDLADPAHPILKSELEIPGWSTYIETDGDRILTVGVEDSKVAISWFDVSDPTSLTMLSRVYPGDGVHSTWSEAGYDHKAVNWVKSEGKVFLPFSQWANAGYTSATQVINVARDGLTLQSVITGNGEARRGTVVNGYLASISGRQLTVCTNPATGPSNEVAWLELSWPVDRVLALDSGLLQIEDGTNYGWWGLLYTGTERSVLRYSSKADPDTVLDSVDLGLGHVLSATQKGSMVYVAQYVPAAGPSPLQLRTWALMISAAGKIEPAGSVSTLLNDALIWPRDNSSVQPLWVDAGTLAWYLPVQPGNNYYLYPILNIGFIGSVQALTTGTTRTLQPASSTTATIAGSIFPSIQSNLCALVCPVTIAADGSLDAFGAVSVQSPSDGSLSSVSKAFTSNGFVYFSGIRQGVMASSSKNQGQGTLNSSFILTYSDAKSVSSLHVLDFRAGPNPVVRDPVSIAGALVAVGNVDSLGATLVTTRKGEGYYGYDRLTSLAYDNASAYEMDTFYITRSMSTGFVSSEDRVYYGLGGGYVDSASGQLLLPAVNGVHVDAFTGKMEVQTSWTLANGASSLSLLGNRMLASAWGSLEVANLLPDGTLQPSFVEDLPAAVWLNVDRAALDPALTGLWLPAGDYGVEFVGLK